MAMGDLKACLTVCGLITSCIHAPGAVGVESGTQGCRVLQFEISDFIVTGSAFTAIKWCDIIGYFFVADDRHV